MAHSLIRLHRVMTDNGRYPPPRAAHFQRSGRIHSPAEPIPDFPPPQMRFWTTVETSEQVDTVLFEGTLLFDATYDDITMSDASGPRRAWR